MNVEQVKPNATTPAAPAAPASRMSIKHARKGIIEVPHRVLIYGAEKVGKSTFAASAPNPIFIGKDSGTEHLDVARLAQPRTWQEFLQGLHAVLLEKHDYETLVVDPFNWLEPLCHAEIVGDSGVSIEAWDGGYGRGYDAAVDKFRIALDVIERVWSERSMNVIFTAHAQVKKFNDPQGPGYDRYELEMANKRVAAKLKQWVETILFAQREAFGKVDKTTKKAKAHGSSARMMHTEWNPAFDAGNRWLLPPELALSWHDYVEAVKNGKARKAELLKQIESALVELADAELEKKVRVYLADPRVSVVEIWNKLSAKLGAKREEQADASAPATNTNETKEEGVAA